MSTELHWPRRSTFHEPAADGSDQNTEERYYDGPGTFEVPDEMVEQYLDRGWQHPDEAGGEEAPAPAEQEPTEDPEPDAESGDDDSEGADPDESESEDFDAAGFVDESWQAVVAAIEDGEADGHLDAVREAEQDRDDGEPRDSVIEALDNRV